jgi:hypothetical protein
MKNKLLKSVKVTPKDHERFMIDCIRADMNQDEMFKEYQKAFRQLESAE